MTTERKLRVLLIPVETIDFITASDSYAELHVGPKTHIIREKMQRKKMGSSVGSGMTLEPDVYQLKTSRAKTIRPLVFY